MSEHEHRWVIGINADCRIHIHCRNVRCWHDGKNRIESGFMSKAEAERRINAVPQLEAELKAARGEIELLSQGEATTMLMDRLLKLGWRPPNIFTKLEEFWRRHRR